MPTPSSIIVIAGLPGAGKSTVAARLASLWPHAAHIEADQLQRMIVSGGRWPTSDAALDGEATRQLALRLRSACMLARAFSDAGFTAIVDDICIGPRLQALRTELGRPFCFVMLHPRLDVLAARNAARASAGVKRDAFAQARALFDVVERETERIGLWLDTSALDADATAHAIHARLGEAAVA